MFLNRAVVIQERDAFVKKCYDNPIIPMFLSLSLSDVADEMLSFFLTLFQALRVQMGVAFTEQIIQTFLGMFTR